MDHLKALVVENSTVYQSMLQQLMESRGFNALCVRSGQEALDLLEFDTFDLVCVAMSLSDFSGTELCQRIRQIDEPVAASVPIVMITAEEDKPVLQAAMRAGATQIFNKKNLQAFDQFLENKAFNRHITQPQTGNILYLEDSASQAQHVMALLHGQGHTVKHVTSVEDALPQLSSTEFDLILSDVILDGKLNGLDLVVKIRNQEELVNLPILCFSAAEDSARRLELLKAGANDYISKPVVDEELILRVSNSIRSKKLVDQLEKQQKHLIDMAMKDQLTGLYNRHFLMEVGPQRISEAHRHMTPLSLLVIDVDKFKRINDDHGHSVGDSILSGLADVFLSSTRNEDIAARFGGEEFVLMLSRCDLDNAMVKAERLREKVEKLCPSDLEVTISIGVASLKMEPKDDLSSLFERADRATYTAKDQGRNRVITLDE